MPQFVLKDAFVEINGVDLSDRAKSVTVNYEAEMKDKTAMGQTGRRKMPGLLNGTFEVEFFQDYSSSSVDGTIFDLVGSTAVPFDLRAVNAAVASTNPRYTGNCLVASYQPIRGAVGDEAMAPVSFEVDGLIDRSTTAT